MKHATSMTRRHAALLCGATLTAWAADSKNSNDRVRLLRLPEGGLQPQTAVDDRGVLHVVYFSGEPAGGNLFYVRSTEAPVRVNSQPASAIATGTIRGAQLALGRNGRVHVAW